jgi:hypothetical protein
MHHLWTDARLGFCDVWGIQYPSNFLIDDIKKIKPLEFAHQFQMIRSRIWKARTGTKTDSNEMVYESFMNELLLLREVS